MTELLYKSNTEAFLYGFTHLFGGDIIKMTEPNLCKLDDIQQSFNEKNEKIRLEIEQQCQQLEEEIKQIKQTEK